MSTPTTPQKTTTLLTLQGLENAVTPLRNRLLLTPTRNTLKKRYDPLADLRVLADLFQLVEPLEPLEPLDMSIPEDNFNIQSFTTRNLSGFRLSGSSTVGPIEDTSFDTSRRTRLSMSSIPNTSNIAIPEAIYHQNDNNNDNININENENDISVGQLDEFEIPNFTNYPITLDKKKPLAFNQNDIKKLISSLGNWNISPDVTNLIIESSNEFISHEFNILSQMATLEGYNTINVLNILDLINLIDLPFDLFGNKSQNEIFDLSIKLFDLEDTRNLNKILWPSKRRRQKKFLPTIPDESDNEENDDDDNSLSKFINDNHNDDDANETVDLDTLTTEIGIGITPDSPLDYDDEYDIPMAEEEEEEEEEDN